MNNYEFETRLYAQGCGLIAGVDEAGRGPLAGPVVACSCIMPKGIIIEGVTDSKKLTDVKRRTLVEIIKQTAIDYQVCFIDEKEIDRINIYQASKKAMEMAISAHHIRPDYVLTDAMKLDIGIPHEAIIKGDLLSYSISCASIIAKVARDDYMIQLARQYPLYGFEVHKGYPTKKHLEALQKYGVLDIHRRTYQPVASLLK
jgi:ribonuclease HII